MPPFLFQCYQYFPLRVITSFTLAPLAVLYNGWFARDLLPRLNPTLCMGFLGAIVGCRCSRSSLASIPYRTLHSQVYHWAVLCDGCFAKDSLARLNPAFCTDFLGAVVPVPVDTSSVSRLERLVQWMVRNRFIGLAESSILHWFLGYRHSCSSLANNFPRVLHSHVHH